MKLRKMLEIANKRGDIMGRYHNVLFLGNASERVKVLEESGNMPLAYISAKLHNLEEDAERIKIAIETNGGSVEGLCKYESFIQSCVIFSDSCAHNISFFHYRNSGKG
jgi:hypothetical protein